MIDLPDKTNRPTLEEKGGFIRNPVFLQFCQEIKDTYNFTVMVVVGKKKKHPLRKSCRSARRNCRTFIVRRRRETGSGG